MDLGLLGKHALVCAGSSGIGYAAARRFALEGAQVTIVAKTPSKLEQAAATLRAETGTSVTYIAADLASASDRTALIASWGSPDILVTSPGIPQSPMRYQDLNAESWRWWFEAHFHSAIDLIYAAVPGMCERGFGRVVNISANFIKFPQVGVGQSHGPRLALAGAIASLVREVAMNNVTINSVLPGLIDTPALRGALSARAQAGGVPYETVAAQVRARCAADRICDAQEAGDLIVMLCAVQMGYVTGQNIVNDGGAYQGLF